MLGGNTIQSSGTLYDSVIWHLINLLTFKDTVYFFPMFPMYGCDT